VIEKLSFQVFDELYYVIEKCLQVFDELYYVIEKCLQVFDELYYYVIENYLFKYSMNYIIMQ